ncbi:uncharacterized protein LOC114288146 [Camellia sinensis]|uniref:uncharacterized protein LOC114288146 n=1 Tax=Camellia sinensis TaxID=4442 RepID=UPI001035ED4C|nr:uncharacterized protein LOC114288146 [Camellia sinensis]
MVGGSGCHVVDVIVGDKRVVEVDDGNSCRTNSVTCESSFVNDCDDVGGLLRSFYPKPERVLLSASWKGIIHSVGQEFEGEVPGFRIALAKYAVECDFAVNYLKNNATRVTAECMMKSSTGCKWFVHGRVLMDSGVFFIMKLDNVHTCRVVARRSCSKMVGSRLVSDIVQNDISDNPLTRPIELRWYLETAMRTNPGSVFELDVDESSGCFRRLFVAFHGCLYGFQFCRPLLFVDGTFLKGHLLAATSKDGNQGLFPLDFAIVDPENQDNWMWFLSQLLKAVGSGRRLTFVSDLKCAYAPTVASFQHYMEKLRRIARNGRVDSMLDGLQNDKWANAFFRRKRYGEMSSNAAESYNNWIGGARELPITCMVDMIRVQIMIQLSDRRAESRR